MILPHRTCLIQWEAARTRAGDSIVELSRRWTTRKDVESLCLEVYFTNRTYQNCAQQFQLKCPVVPVPGKQTDYDLIHRFRETRSVKDRSRIGCPSALTPAFLETVAINLQRFPKKCYVDYAKSKTRHTVHAKGLLRVESFILTNRGSLVPFKRIPTLTVKIAGFAHSTLRQLQCGVLFQDVKL